MRDSSVSRNVAEGPSGQSRRQRAPGRQPEDSPRPPARASAARPLQTPRAEVLVMLHYAVVFFIIAIIAAVFGFGGIASGAAGIAKILFVVFLVVAGVSLLLGRRRTLGLLRPLETRRSRRGARASASTWMIADDRTGGPAERPSSVEGETSTPVGSALPCGSPMSSQSPGSTPGSSSGSDRSGSSAPIDRELAELLELGDRILKM